jgi:tetratricopeptide (TPR) repeat protein
VKETPLKFKSWPIVALSAFLAFTGSHSLRAQSSSNDQLVQRARQEFQEGKFTDAERDFREITRRDPSNLGAQLFLGQSLFRQQKFADAVIPFEKARELEAGSKKGGWPRFGGFPMFRFWKRGLYGLFFLRLGILVNEINRDERNAPS